MSDGSRRRSAARRITIVYVVSRWGEPTQTFVRREVGAVVDAGAQVRVLSLKRPRACGVPVDVIHLGPVGLLRGLVRTLALHPRQSARVLGCVIRRSAPGNCVPQVAAALVGLAWAASNTEAVDLLHVHFGWVATTAAWALTRVTGGQYSVVLHAFELHTQRYLDDFAPRPLRDAVAVFTISVGDVDLVRRRWGIEAQVLRMGVSDEWLDAGSLTTRDPWRVVSVGSLVPKKGHATLLEALMFADQRWRLTIVGDGPLRGTLTAMAEVRDLDGRIELVGTLSEDQVRTAVRGAGAFALAAVETASGDRDGIPVALMEAMACGTPVVTTRTGAIAELVEGCGILVPSEDPRALADALDALRDSTLRSELGIRGRARVAAEFRSSPSGERVMALARAQES